MLSSQDIPNNIINKKLFLRVKKFLENYPADKKAMIVIGDIGVGKTFLIKTAAKMTGYKLIYPSSKDEITISVLRTTRDYFDGSKLALHLDRPYNELKLKGRDIRRIILKARIPVFIEDTFEHKKYYSKLENVEILDIRLTKPQVVAFIKKYFKDPLVKIDFKKIPHHDVRQAILMTLGSVPPEEDDEYLLVSKLLAHQEIRGLEWVHLPIIVDNIGKWYADDLFYLAEVIEQLDLLLSQRGYANIMDFGDLGFLIPRPTYRQFGKPEKYYFEKLKAYREIQKIM